MQESVRDPDFLAEHEAFYGKQHRVARLSSHMLPSYSVPQGLLVLDYGREIAMLSSGAPGKSLTIPWE